MLFVFRFFAVLQCSAHHCAGITKPVLLVEKNGAGKTNLEVFMDRLQAKPAAAADKRGAPASSALLLIEDLKIEGGALKLAGEVLGSWRRIDLRRAGSAPAGR
ncbi:MAG: hypothetical protein QM757_31560 [Paludibaculum sp.]